MQQQALSGTTSVRIGDTSNGFDLTVTVTGAVAPPPIPPPVAPMPPPAAATAIGRPAAPVPPAGPPPGLDVTMVPHSGGPGPGGFGGGPGLLVRVDGPDKRFPGGQPVRIGREPGLEVVCDDPVVSRQHAIVESRPDGWWLVDRSTTGTFIDGERITQRKLEEPTEVLLGHPTAGYELELVPVVAAGVAAKSIARKKRRKTLAVAAAAVAVLLVVGGGVTAAVLLGDDDGGGSGSPQSAEGGEGLTEKELDRAKAATVFLLAYGEDGEPSHSGSGSVISEDGLILTNAHVADPAAPGQDTDPVAFVDVGFTDPDDDDRPVELRYRAETIVSDGVLDLAIVKIVADAEGNEVDASDLDLPEPLPVGDSDGLRTNDEITALGYPGLATANSEFANEGELPALTVTTGRVATFTGSDVLDTERAEIDADLRIGSGNSGGPSIDEPGRDRRDQHPGVHRAHQRPRRGPGRPVHRRLGPRGPRQPGLRRPRHRPGRRRPRVRLPVPRRPHPDADRHDRRHRHGRGVRLVAPRAPRVSAGTPRPSTLRRSCRRRRATSLYPEFTFTGVPDGASLLDRLLRLGAGRAHPDRHHRDHLGRRARRPVRLRRLRGPRPDAPA